MTQTVQAEHVEALRQAQGERRVVKRLLIANRGEIARRIIRTAHAMGISTVAVYSDADAQALHVREATLAHALGGNASADTYLRIDKLLAAAQATGADAVHPGYDFLSENADFALAVIDAGLIWVGPPPEAIRQLGSKSAAKAIAQARGVPCLPGYYGADQSDATLLAEAQRIGLPLMVKAAAGGGGRGMRDRHGAIDCSRAGCAQRSTLSLWLWRAAAGARLAQPAPCGSASFCRCPWPLRSPG